MSDDILRKKDQENKSELLWNSRGFYIGMAVGTIVSLGEAVVLIEQLGRGSISNQTTFLPIGIGLIVAIILGLRARKYGYLSGFFAGLFIAIGLPLLLLLAFCAYVLSKI